MLDTPLADTVESLVYWRRRQATLPWYRRSERREAGRMVLAWERRARAALVRQTDAPMTARIEAGWLVTRTHLARWGRRAGMAVMATAALTAMVAGATFALVLHAV
jgi:hypothetical protein